MKSKLKKATIFCAAALLATGAVATYATTPESYSSEEVRELSLAPYANLSNSKQTLMFISQAESLVFKGDSTFAKMHINEALSTAARLPSSPDANDLREVHRVAVITLMDGAVEREYLLVQPDNITTPLNFNPENLPLDTYQISKTEIQYVHPKWNKEQLLVSLNKMLRDIESGKNVSAGFDKLHAMLLEDNAETVSDRRAAQDNIALARALIRAKAYEPAKAAMARADEHIAALAKDKRSPKRFEDIATMRNEMATVGTDIERNEPAAFQELDQKFEKWWNLLS